MKILFLDESGDHNLTIIDPQYPVFVLGGVIIDRAYAEGEMTERVRDFKLRLFGRDDIIGDTVGFLLSPETGYITGQNLVVDGGMSRSY